MLTWLGGALYRARWGVLLVAFLLTIFFAWYGFGVFDALHGTALEDPNSESIRARTLLDTTFSSSSTTTDSLVLLLSHPGARATDPSFTQNATRLLNTIKARPGVIAVTSYYNTHDSTFLSYNGEQTFALVELSTRDGESAAYAALSPYLTAPGLHVDAGGSLASDLQFNSQLSHDLAFSESIALPIVALLLVFIFRGLIAALLPLIIGGVAIVNSFAIIRLLTRVTSVSDFATNVVTIIGLGLAIDYSLFIVTRFREEMTLNDNDVRTSIQRTMATAGRTILFSGLTVCTSLLSLLLFPETLFRSIGLATISAALIAMLGALTILPALLTILGRRVNALSIQRIFPRRQSTTPQQGFWYHLSYIVMRWRIPVSIVTILVLLLLGTPFLHASFQAADDRSLPDGTSSRFVAQQLRQNFPDQQNTTLNIAVRTPGNALSSTNLASLDTYVRTLEGQPHVLAVQSLVTVDPRLSLADYQRLYARPSTNPQLAAAAQQLAEGDITRITVTVNADSHSTQARDLVQHVRALKVSGGLVPLVGGDTAEELDQFASIGAALPFALLVMAAAIFLLLFLMTGSLVIPLKAIILNVLSLTATFGALVWIFQDGHLQNLLAFQAFGSLDSTQPILIFAIAFGLSMDYEVFLLSRIKEQFDRTGDNREAVAVGLQRTGALITSAALLLAVVVAAFATSRIIFIQEIGVGISLAILMDATLVRGLLVPAMMSLLGKWNWWAPRPLQRLWRTIGLRESSITPPSDDDIAEKAATMV